MSTKELIGVTILIITFIWLLITAISVKHLRFTGNTVTGTVIDVHRSQSGRTVTVRYRARPPGSSGGLLLSEPSARQEFTSSLSSWEWWLGVQRHDSITLFYSPSNPNRVTSGRLSISAWVILVTAALVAALVVANAIQREKKERAERQEMRKPWQDPFEDTN